MNNTPQIAILMGSDSDWDVMSEAGKVLKGFDIPFEMLVTSAHRTPERTHAYAKSAAARGILAFIVGAGAAAHLAGVIASESNLPVIGVPLSATELKGMDALLATVQMPGGVPVATMAIGKAGAKNAGIFAAQILALSDPQLAAKLVRYREEMAAAVTKKNEALQAKLADF
ncbi:phosphoribosylaminoimidazole carboxylase, catalytic subunit [Magnetococcus marinus MC-1]|uniref:N5-carboxyaminoimidazole ribonucleotide mutase n=1 Tax=Magnetococcus marinus (strain ATCC BAA-1437 / JCM 17883 / MC-1) TaxID=156889 RepID=A0LDA6_MAGMM|nr:5-(carboxyamino)imidazole ribonucleotide mutase [Magnetococcus marinus]ABK45949.1 phosphoribosylaminoimidazole carboxylase, catalytic subunit [Magnetococcus marinus MC-1]